MVTLHVFFGPRLVPVQVSAVLMNAEEPGTVIFSAEVPVLPELVRLNALDTVWRACSVP
jgi:hypothetical protein